MVTDVDCCQAFKEYQSQHHHQSNCSLQLRHPVVAGKQLPPKADIMTKMFATRSTTRLYQVLQYNYIIFPLTLLFTYCGPYFISPATAPDSLAIVASLATNKQISVFAIHL